MIISGNRNSPHFYRRYFLKLIANKKIYFRLRTQGLLCSATLMIYIDWSKDGCFTASLDILNNKRLISPEREGFRGSNFVRFTLGVFMFCWLCRLIYLKMGQVGGNVPLNYTNKHKILHMRQLLFMSFEYSIISSEF